MSKEMKQLVLILAINLRPPETTTLYVFTCTKIASFPGPAQLFVTCSTEKRGEPGIFSHVSMT